MAQARKFDTAARWANILTDEFSNQGVMEQELQIPSCLFGGPPVRDDLIKLGESQIGFMNIFARPLFEAVADIMPGMQFAVDEILTNKSVWEKKIEQERETKKNGLNFALGLPPPTFAVDPTPSPLSGTPPKSPSNLPDLPSQPHSARSIQSPTKIVYPDDPGRRGSSGSFHAALSNSRRSSLGVDKGSRRSSGAGLPGSRPVQSRENQSQSRRGSGDASLTAILVTQTPNLPETPKESSQSSGKRSTSPAGRKDTLTHSSPKKEKEGIRPVTAPSSARRSQGKSPNAQKPSFCRFSRPFRHDPDFDSANNLYPVPRIPSQSHSEVDLTHPTNGNLDGSKMQQWDGSKMSGDSTISRSDASRESGRRSEWWRQMSSRRRTRDVRNGDADGRPPQKEMLLDPSMSNSTSTVPSPTSLSPGRSSKTGKLKNFFRRKPKDSNEQEKQLSSFGSSSHLRTPPTSDPGQSLNSDD